MRGLVRLTRIDVEAEIKVVVTPGVRDRVWYQLVGEFVGAVASDLPTRNRCGEAIQDKSRKRGE